MAESATAEDRLVDERLVVWRNRYTEARQAGLTIVEAHMFAESDIDIGQLRRLVKARCPVETLRLIVL